MMHKEAFCLMKYATEDGSEVEWLWNSRDGVTPFCILSRTGKEMRHIDWEQDRPMPRYRPRPGERIFVDMTEQRAHALAAEHVEKRWDAEQYPLSASFSSREEAVACFVAEWAKPGAPDIVSGDAYKAPMRARFA